MSALNRQHQQYQPLRREQDEIKLQNPVSKQSSLSDEDFFSDFDSWPLSDIPDEVLQSSNNNTKSQTNHKHLSHKKSNSVDAARLVDAVKIPAASQIDYDDLLNSSPPADVLDCFSDVEVELPKDEVNNKSEVPYSTKVSTQHFDLDSLDDLPEAFFNDLATEPLVSSVAQQDPEIISSKSPTVPLEPQPVQLEPEPELQPVPQPILETASFEKQHSQIPPITTKRCAEQLHDIIQETAVNDVDLEPKSKIPKLGDKPKPNTKTHAHEVRQSRLTGFVDPLLPAPDPSTLVDPGVLSNGTQPLAVSNSKDLKPAPIFLSAEQRRVIDLVVHNRKSLFFTGAAGTGKSILLRRIIRELKKKHKKGEVAVTASTGLAACNIGGITLHSFCGIGLGQEDAEGLLKKVRNNPQALKRWKKIKTLIIDETSMIDGNLFDKLEYLARKIKRKTVPFGGIQVVLSGDFFQLPPVFKQETDIYGEPLEKTENRLAFQANTWNSVIEVTVELKQVFRQKDDHFSRMLGSIRRGVVTKDIEQEFRALSRALDVPEGITPTEVYPLRNAVDRANRTQMNKLPGEAITFKSVDTYNSEAAKRGDILKFLMCPESISFKVGAQVMLIKNMDETLVNGSLGKVVGFMSESAFKIMTQLPREYTDRISKGIISVEEGVEEYLHEPDKPDSSIDSKADISTEACDEDDGFDDYRWSTPENDDPFGIPENYKQIDSSGYSTINWERKKMWVEMLQEQAQNVGKKWPYVRFMIPDGTTRDVLVQAEKWDIENLDGKVEASRSQVPLILAWALSVHKCQGQTLHWVKVDLRTIFEHGQSYVALSRAVNMEGLQVVGFDKSKITVHPDVIEFYENLPSPLDI